MRNGRIRSGLRKPRWQTRVYTVGRPDEIVASFFGGSRRERVSTPTCLERTAGWAEADIGASRATRSCNVQNKTAQEQSRIDASEGHGRSTKFTHSLKEAGISPLLSPPTALRERCQGSGFLVIHPSIHPSSYSKTRVSEDSAASLLCRCLSRRWRPLRIVQRTGTSDQHVSENQPLLKRPQIPRSLCSRDNVFTVLPELLPVAKRYSAEITSCTRP